MSYTITPFEGQDKYTTFNNYVLDQIMPQTSPNAWKCLCLIIRKTRGWHKQSDELSFSQIKKGTGIKSDPTISSALTELEQAGYILIKRSCNQWTSNSYSLNTTLEIIVDEPSTIKNIVDTAIENIVVSTIESKDTKEKKRNKKQNNNNKDSYSLDSNWAQVQKLWETNIGFLAPAIVTQAQALMDEIPQPAQVQYFQEAITRACAANARNWNYIKAILTRWIDQGGIDLNGSGKRQSDPAESSPLPPTDPTPEPAPLAPHAAAWEAARRLLAGSVTAATFDQVIAHCQAQPGHNGTFVLGVPADKLVHVRRAEKPILLALKQVTNVTELEVTTL